MYKYIKSSYDDVDIRRSVHRATAEMINDPVGSKLYGKIMNVTDDEKIAFIEGIFACAEAAGISIKGINELYELMITEGVETVTNVLMK